MAGKRAAARSAERFPAFNGLRAIAAGLVVAYHLSQATDAARIHLLAPFTGELKAGVTVFFVISGFLLYLPYARAIGVRGPLPNWRRFAGRRATRILPAYWVALTLVALAPFANDVLGSGWWRFYSLTQIYDRGTVFGGLGVAWTLCVEVSFYAFLPVFAWGAAKLARRAPARHAVGIQLGLAGALALGSLVLRAVEAHSLTAPIVAHGFLLATSLPGLFDWFAIGMALAVITAEWETGSHRFALLRAMVRRPGGCWLLAGCFFIFAAVSWPLEAFLPDYGTLTHVLIGIAAGCLVLPAIDPAPMARRAAPVRLLTHPWMAWLGTISYGIYLWHLQLLQAIGGPIAGVAAHPPGLAASLGLVAVTVTGAIALGAASWYLVELPAGRRFGRRRHDKPPAAPSLTPALQEP